MKQFDPSSLQIDWQEENASNAAHVVSPSRRTIGNALVGPTKMSKSPTIAFVSRILGYSSRRRVQYDLFGDDRSHTRDGPAWGEQRSFVFTHQQNLSVT